MHCPVHRPAFPKIIELCLLSKKVSFTDNELLLINLYYVLRVTNFLGAAVHGKMFWNPTINTISMYSLCFKLHIRYA